MNKKVLGLVFSGVVAVCGVFMTSCKDGDAENLEYDAKTAVQFNSTLRENVESFMEVPVVVNPTTRVALPNGSPALTDVKRVYVDMPLGEQPVKLEGIKTSGQIFTLVRETGAELTLIDKGNNSPSIDVSEEECMEALAPLIRDSKKYLYGKGFTETEIQEMLRENNVDESALVPFVLALAEEEANQNNVNVTRSVDWGQVGSCALHAIGADIFYGLDKSMLKTWSKKLIMKAFKTAAVRACGPIGVAITVVDFSVCCWG